MCKTIKNARETFYRGYTPFFSLNLSGNWQSETFETEKGQTKLHQSAKGMRRLLEGVNVRLRKARAIAQKSHNLCRRAVKF